MKAVTYFFTAVLTLVLSDAQAQTTAANSCDIYIGTYFCPNCPMDTAQQGWQAIYPEPCNIVKINYKVYNQDRSKVIHNSPERWEGILDAGKTPWEFYPTGDYPYVLEFYKKDNTLIRKEGKVHLMNYDRTPKIR